MQIKQKSGLSFRTGCLTFIIALFFIGFFVSLFEQEDKKSWLGQDNATMAYLMMEDFVKQRLKSPKSADFPGFFDGRYNHVKYLGNQKYLIDSYVDAQNSFGAIIRNNFIGKIEQTSRDSWSLISLEISSR